MTSTIVMGRIAHRGVGRLIGSTVEHLLYKMPCSVGGGAGKIE
jgi:universal stress protein E